MLISVVTPTFNSAETIRENIHSVISQTYSSFEQIIVDNASSDKTLEIAKRVYAEAGVDEKLKIISEKDKGISDAFNKGIRAASGEIIIILNSDDAFYNKDVVQDAVNALKDKNKLIAHGDIYFVDEVYGSNIRQPLKNSLIDVVYNHPGMFIKKEVYDTAGLYDVDYTYSMDFEFFCRLYSTYGGNEKISVYLEKPLVTMKAGGASWDNEIKSIQEIKRGLKKHGLWGTKGLFYYSGRMFRAKLKSYITKAGLNSAVKVWRKLKWKG